MIDDEERIRQFLVDALESLDHDADALPSGAAALAWLRDLSTADTLDAVILDVAIPGEQVADTLQSLRQAVGDTPIIVSSGQNLAAMADRLLALGANVLLAKPYRFDELAETLEQLTG